jgi:hypothetical protein
MFATMPPLCHDKDHAQSEILNHIAAELDANGKGDLSCLAVFDSIRQPRRKIIRFCAETKRWMGVDYQPEKEA